MEGTGRRLAPVDDLNLIRLLVRLRTRDRVPEESLAHFGATNLRARPEATLVAIVRGWHEFRANGYAEADIYREIEARRSREYGAEPLPSDLTLESFARYRMRLEHPAEAALHEPEYVAQAVRLASRACEREFGPHGEPPGVRSMPAGHLAVLAYAVLVVAIQGLGNLGKGLGIRVAPDAWVNLALAVMAFGLAAAVFAWIQQARSGRAAAMAMLAAEIALGWLAVAHGRYTGEAMGFVEWAQGINTLLAAASLAYVYRWNADARA